jgi:FdhD protein
LGRTNRTNSYEALRCEQDECRSDILELIGEEPLMLRVEDKPYSVVMRTPGDEINHAAGTCLGEGIIDSSEDFKTIGWDENLDPNIVDVWLTDERKEKIPHILARKSYISQTSCGICGKGMIEDLQQVLVPVGNGFEVSIEQALECAGKLSKNQNFYHLTRGSHAALIFDQDLNDISFAEDVGRHNALDKAIGHIVMNGRLANASLLVMSSRVSYELVQKAARARISTIVSISRPTSMAVQMAKGLNMTLACAFQSKKLLVLCGNHRIKHKKEAVS